MEINFGSRVKRAWNAFLNRDPPQHNNYTYYGGYKHYPPFIKTECARETMNVTSIYKQISGEREFHSLPHI